MTFDAEGGHLFSHPAGRSGVDIGNQHVGSFAGKAQGDTSADATSSSSHVGDFPSKFHGTTRAFAIRIREVIQEQSIHLTGLLHMRHVAAMFERRQSRPVWNGCLMKRCCHARLLTPADDSVIVLRAVEISLGARIAQSARGDFLQGIGHAV